MSPILMRRTLEKQSEFQNPGYIERNSRFRSRLCKPSVEQLGRQKASWAPQIHLRVQSNDLSKLNRDVLLVLAFRVNLIHHLAGRTQNTANRVLTCKLDTPVQESGKWQHPSINTKFGVRAKTCDCTFELFTAHQRREHICRNKFMNPPSGLDSQHPQQQSLPLN